MAYVLTTLLYVCLTRVYIVSSMAAVKEVLKIVECPISFVILQ